MFCEKCGSEYENGTCPKCTTNTKKNKSVFSMWYLWFILGALCASMIFWASGMLNLDSSEQNKKVDTTIAPNNKKETEAGKTKGKASAKSSKKENSTEGIGTELKSSDRIITVTNVMETTVEGMHAPDDGNIFIAAEICIENTSDHDIAVSQFLIEIYADGLKCTQSPKAALYMPNGSSLNGNIESGRKLKGYLHVEGPEDWEELEIVLKSDANDKSPAKIYIKNTDNIKKLDNSSNTPAISEPNLNDIQMPDFVPNGI